MEIPMNQLFDIEKGFQTSVNIGYDLNNPKKIRDLIPTTDAIKLAEDILLSTSSQSTRRARFLIGAYGKGKSHIILVILSMLFCKDKGLYSNFLKKVKSYNPDVYDFMVSYLQSDKKILPVVIDGNSNTLTQSFLGALYETLRHYGLSDIMPDTHFKAALHMIELWKEKFPKTYRALQEYLNQPIGSFILRLKQYDVSAYEIFKKIYPNLTAGSEFNPFSGVSVVDIYDSVNRQLSRKGYQGIYVVYDEFSKYLESNITSTSAGDVKMLQDFAEKCNRSGAQQLHLLMILHKEIENYIDKLSKQKVDGWRGVAERFAHVVLQTDYSQTYEVIAHAIKKKTSLWHSFLNVHQAFFTSLMKTYQGSLAFKECTEKELKDVVYGCYPLHPITTFILPRISEKVAQNERTLFTFIAGDDRYTLPFLLTRSEDSFLVVTPDVLYDYFAPQMKKAIFDSEIHQLYKLASRLLIEQSLADLEAKIVKTIVLIYALGQFNKLPPTISVIHHIYQSAGYTQEEVQQAIDTLIQKQCIIYLKRSNAYLKLKSSSGVQIFDEIKRVQAKRAGISTIHLLNEMNPIPYGYPNRYNDKYDMVRYFSFEFVAGEELKHHFHPSFSADGMIYAICPRSKEELCEIKEIIGNISQGESAAIFALPRQFEEVEGLCKEYDAVSVLREEAREDQSLFEEYDVIYQDLLEVIDKYIADFSHPESGKIDYYYRGEKVRLYRKSSLSDLMSSICEKRFPATPIINNEMLNKSKLTSVAMNSRAKLLNGLIQNFELPNLGLMGSGQDVSFLRSALINTGVLKNADTVPVLDIDFCDAKLANVLQIIKNFIIETQDSRGKNLGVLYERLLGDAYGIGLRKGIMPIYLAVVIKQFNGHAILANGNGEVPFSADTLQKINERPTDYTVQLEVWNKDKEIYISKLEELFSAYLPLTGIERTGYEYILVAMNRWYLSLPRYVKDLRKSYVGHESFTPIAKEYIKFLSLFKQVGIGAQKILFDKIPNLYSVQISLADAFITVQKIKGFYDSLVDRLYQVLISEVKEIFAPGKGSLWTLDKACAAWIQSLSSTAKSYLYPDGAERLIKAVMEEAENEYEIISHLSLAMTGLSIDNWNDTTVLSFLKNISCFQKSIVAYNQQVAQEISEETTLKSENSYEIHYVDVKGQSVKKTFTRQEYSRRAKLLYNDIENSMEEMGQSITLQEKRQVLMDILTKLL